MCGYNLKAGKGQNEGSMGNCSCLSSPAGYIWKKLIRKTPATTLPDKAGERFAEDHDKHFIIGCDSLPYPDRGSATIRKTTVSRIVDHNMLCLIRQCTQEQQSMQRLCRIQGRLCTYLAGSISGSGRLASEYMCGASHAHSAITACTTRTRGWRGSCADPGVRIVPRSPGIAQRYIYTSPHRVSYPPG